MRVVALKHRCHFSHEVIRAVTLFNTMNLFSGKEIDIVFGDEPDRRLNKFRLIFGEKPIYCPSAIIEDRFINNTLGAIHDYEYLKRYLG